LGCRRLIADHPREVHVHESHHDRYVVDLDTPQDYANVLRQLRLSASPALESQA
jgi:molybdenum cofactor cytidylyltransferase